MDDIALLKQEIGKVCTVLTGDPGYQGNFAPVVHRQPFAKPETVVSRGT